MWNKILYGLLYGWVKLHAMLPMRMLYLLSDLLYLLVYRIVGYRIKVTRRNLEASFPDRPTKELRKLERRFYHHFCDYIVETIKMAHISLEEIQRRAHIENIEVADKLMDEGHPCLILVMGHYGNWEWYSASTSVFKQAKMYQIYRPLKNQAVDRLFIDLRTRFGSFGIKKNDTIRDIIRVKQSGERSVVIFLADQTPSRANLHYWTNFLNQDTAILTGPERIARKLDLPVVFLDVRKLDRGHYTMRLEPLTEYPRKTAENEITERYTRLLERMILRDPAYWLWTHKRWKYHRENKE